jgi:hypothetical protein
MVTELPLPMPLPSSEAESEEEWKRVTLTSRMFGRGSVGVRLYFDGEMD